mmetsp:Transcript_8342/g.20675  ORF Transcript_8342/g.20675 Transcript_8342/m.20675 type:complete len:114 (-) Transcript_8342:568-909(-)
MRRLRPPPSEEIQVQEELLMTDNIAMNKTDEAFANENEVLDMNAAVKIKRAKLANKTDTEKIEGIWQNGVNDKTNNVTVVKRKLGRQHPVGMQPLGVRAMAESAWKVCQCTQA